MDHAFVGMNTPWGRAHSVQRAAKGVWWVSTPHHGGLWLSPQRMNQLPSKIRHRELSYHVGNQWFEEDCEWSLAWLGLDLPNPDDGRDVRKMARETVSWYASELIEALIEHTGKRV